MAYFWLFVGVVACASSVIWIKLCSVDPIQLTGLRLTLATAILSPLAIRDWRRHRHELNWRHLRDAAIPGIVLVAHFITWIMGARMTFAANGALLVNLSPIVTPFLLFLLAGERVNRKEIFATLFAFLGLVILFVSDYQLMPEHLAGDAMCLTSMLLAAIYLTLGRKFRHHPTNWLYVVPMFGSAGLIAMVISLFFSDWGSLEWKTEYKWIAAIVLIPTILGHSSVMYAMRHIRGQIVTILNMTQFILAGALAWMFLSEIPSMAFFPAAFFLMFAGVLATWPSSSDKIVEQHQEDILEEEILAE